MGSVINRKLNVTFLSTILGIFKTLHQVDYLLSFALSTQGDSEVTSTIDPGALSIKNSLLYLSYFVCLYEKDVSVLIE